MRYELRPMRVAAWALCLLAGAALSGCVSNNMSDLEQYVQRVLAQKSGNIEPLPEIKPYKRYLYQSAAKGLRDPFKPFYQEKAQETAKKALSPEQQKLLNEIKNRNPEELEHFPLDSLRMVGTIRDKGKLWAIVVDPTGTVHRVEKGNYMGQNYGKITNITDDHIELREIISDGQGGYTTRKASLALKEQ